MFDAGGRLGLNCTLNAAVLIGDFRMKAGKIISLLVRFKMGAIKDLTSGDVVAFGEPAVIRGGLTFSQLKRNQTVAYDVEPGSDPPEAYIVTRQTQAKSCGTAMAAASARGWKDGTVIATDGDFGIIKGEGDALVMFQKSNVEPEKDFKDIDGALVEYMDKRAALPGPRVATRVRRKT